MAPSHPNSSTAERPPDIRQEIFHQHHNRLVRAVIRAEAGGVLSGLNRAARMALEHYIYRYLERQRAGTLLYREP